MYMSVGTFGFTLHKALVSHVHQWLFCFLHIQPKVLYNYYLSCVACMELIFYDGLAFAFLHVSLKILNEFLLI